ncbi:hypothetical protein J6590_056610, partial [Homalodisca vitripennis]
SSQQLAHNTSRVQLAQTNQFLAPIPREINSNHGNRLCIEDRARFVAGVTGGAAGCGHVVRGCIRHEHVIYIDIWAIMQLYAFARFEETRFDILTVADNVSYNAGSRVALTFHSILYSSGCDGILLLVTQTKV